MESEAPFCRHPIDPFQSSSGDVAQGLVSRFLIGACFDKPDVFQSQQFARTVYCGEQKAGEERKMVNEEAKFTLISVPMCWSVKHDSEKKDVGSGSKRCLTEESSG